jgi:hypothetical protein
MLRLAPPQREVAKVVVGKRRGDLLFPGEILVAHARRRRRPQQQHEQTVVFLVVYPGSRRISIILQRARWHRWRDQRGQIRYGRFRSGTAATVLIL